MHIRRWTAAITHWIVATLFVTTAATPRPGAIARSSGKVAATPHKPTAQANALVKAIRHATDRFRNVTSISLVWLMAGMQRQ